MLQVYYFSRGKVKPANRNFSTVRNDYTINLDNGCALPDFQQAGLCSPLESESLAACQVDLCEATRQELCDIARIAMPSIAIADTKT